MARVLGVIIPRYVHSEKADDTTNRTVQRVLQVASPSLITKVYVVDNGSTLPFTIQNERINYTKWGDNKGVAAAWNEGWRKAYDASFLCWLNADCLVEAGWDKALCIAADQLGCIAMPYTNGVKSDGVGVTGWCFVAAVDVAERIGPFDEQFSPAYYEDTDWFHRAIQLNIPLLNVPTANVQHTRRQGGTEDAPWFKHVDKLHIANRYRFSWKHGLDPAEPPAFWKEPLPNVEFYDR